MTAKSRRLLRRFELWARADERKGATPPNQWELTVHEYTQAKVNLRTHIKQLETNAVKLKK